MQHRFGLSCRSATSGRLRGKSHTIFHLSAIHAERAVVVEHESVKPQRAANGERSRIQLLCVAVDVNFNLAWTVQQRCLPLLYRQRRTEREQAI